jgi:hypothetical protein
MRTSFGFAAFALLASEYAFALFVQKPCCSAFPHAGASFGPQLPWTSPGVFGVVSRGEDKDCQGGIAGTVVLIDRGLEPFVDTVRACQAKGAVAVIVRNVASSGGSIDDLVVMGAPMHEAGTVAIPSIFVSRKTGDELDAMLAMNPNVFVELFAADDVNSLMAYLAYVVMSAESLFFAMLFMLVLVVIGTRKRRSTRGGCWRRCRRNDHETSYSRHALLVNDQALVEPLHHQQQPSTSNGRDLMDPESKLVTITTSYPVVFNNPTAASLHNGSNTQVQRLVSIPVNAVNNEPVFEQQEQ